MKHLRGLAVAAAGAIALSACSSGGPPPVAETDTITIMAPFFSTAPPERDDDIELELERIIGKKVDINWVPNAGYGDRTNITLAGSELPHLMVLQGKDPGIVSNAEAGAFWDLTDRLDRYPNLKTTMPEIQRAASVNGRVFGVFRARDKMRASVLVRKDWLDELGLPMPRTVEDLYTVAKAFTTQDPDGNGVADTHGLIVPLWPGQIGTNHPFDIIETWFGAGNRWTERDGQLIPSFMTPEFMQAVAFERRMASEGLFNPDWVTFDTTNWNEPFFTGKGGMIIDVHSRAQQVIKLFKEKNPADFERFVDVTGNLLGPDGVLRAHPSSGFNGFIAIPKQKVRTEADLDAMLTILDRMNSKEAAILLFNGIEGTHFTLKDGRAVSADSKKLSEQTTTWQQLLTGVTGEQYYQPSWPTPYEQGMWDKRKSIEASDYEHAVFDPAAPYVSKTYTSKGGQLYPIVTDARIKYVAGQIDEQGLRDAIALWRSSGGDQIIKEINELARAGG
jgi:putative aldouronate transport system substrate-binding protein